MEREEALKLFKENGALVTHTLNKYFPWLIMDEDIWQSAYEYFWNACLSWDGVSSFSNYAITSMVYSLRSDNKANKRKKRFTDARPESLDYITRNDDENMAPIPDSLVVYDQHIVWINKKSFVELLSDRQREILHYILLGIPCYKIAPFVGTSHETVNKERHKIIDIFKDNIMYI